MGLGENGATMETLFESLTRRLGSLWNAPQRKRTRRAFRCRCDRPVFFGNSLCLGCHTPLGYEPGSARVAPLLPLPAATAGEAPLWRLHGDDDDAPAYRRCANFDSAAGCNWLLPAAEAEAHAGLCRACRLNLTIPDQDVAANRDAWQRIEVAKRRLVSALLGLNLPVASRETEDPDHGLVFEFLRSPPEGPRVLTGHANGTITLNIEEADDARREQIRNQLREPYRTLLGHLRHEVGHYYWDRLVWQSRWLEPFRAIFGDEREDYAAALKAHYVNGPRPDWPQAFVSSYASSHPWEDWAETWAHYLHMVDTLDTALSFGLDADNVEVDTEPFAADVLDRPDPEFLSFVNAWIELSALLNEMSRAMGQSDFYPFVLSRAAVRKLHFVHGVVRGVAAEAARA